MSFIIDWITNIIIFILLAIVIDLLLPSTNLQKYVKMVIGLILILVMLSPILKIFKVDVDQLIAMIHTEGHAEKNVIENVIEQKKTEIQASQRAYILEQMAVHMKKDVAEELMNQYGLTIKDITFEIGREENFRIPDDIQFIEVIVAPDKKEQSGIVPTVQPIEIDTSEPMKRTDEYGKLAMDTASFLAKKWGVNEEKIAVQVEGGR
ncbi:stage III sporulation protein AF [Anoxybacillus calidus]|jgi:stage III sporulation protein AF|uniref:Stage III sporulation protein AF n=1 Tax=[Anoxybacillus] calidus TaxID=575178 RepID=A0A7V9YWU6_9BACL|nr:stage III sporulation protein AF [Anoxybacillus calidus]MBA2869942.1 stage III sporulation protein AF [Anoxybacillus calidus]